MNIHTTNNQRGFTLIELLVVIAIIGILASVVLASLNSARDSGEDASAISSMNSARAQSELYYNDNSRSYDGVCTAASIADPGGIASLIAGAESAVGFTATCGDDAESWAAEIQLNSGDFFCADYTGASTTTAATSITTNAVNGDTTYNTCG